CRPPAEQPLSVPETRAPAQARLRGGERGNRFIGYWIGRCDLAGATRRTEDGNGPEKSLRHGHEPGVTVSGGRQSCARLPSPPPAPAGAWRRGPTRLRVALSLAALPRRL